jgi:class 3 adenylate cyclase
VQPPDSADAHCKDILFSRIHQSPSAAETGVDSEPIHCVVAGRDGEGEDLLPEYWAAGSEAHACAERHELATVLCMDIVGYTGQCAALGLDELSGWMSRIHAAIDVLLARHAVRRVETRGDCIVCLTGTGPQAPRPPGPSGGGEGVWDGTGDQATRMLAFARELCAALGGVDGTAARMGMATGPVVLAQVAHSGDARPAQYVYGGAAELAQRLEQTGRAGTVQLGGCAARAYAAETGGAEPPLRVRGGRGAEGCGGLVAVFDCAAGRFLEGDGGAASTVG